MPVFVMKSFDLSTVLLIYAAIHTRLCPDLMVIGGYRKARISDGRALFFCRKRAPKKFVVFDKSRVTDPIMPPRPRPARRTQLAVLNAKAAVSDVAITVPTDTSGPCADLMPVVPEGRCDGDAPARLLAVWSLRWAAGPADGCYGQYRRARADRIALDWRFDMDGQSPENSETRQGRLGFSSLA